MPNCSEPPQTTLWKHYPTRKDYPFLLGILLLGTWLRFYSLNEPGLWLDEISYTIAAQRPIISQIINPTETLGGYLSVDPTLSAIPFSLSLKLGFSNFLVRFPATVFGILSIALIYTLGRVLFNNLVGLIAALLLCVSSFHILYSQEARSYTQFIFFSMASILFLYKAITRNKFGDWVFYILCTWAGVSTNHIMLFTIAGQGIFLFLVYIQNILWTSKNLAMDRITVKVFGYFFLSIALVLVLRLPWLEDFTQRQCAGCAIGRPSYLLNLTGSLIRSIEAYTRTDPNFSLILITLCLLGLIFGYYYCRTGGLFIASWLILSFLITTIGLWFISQFFHERYTIWGLPAFFLSVACGLIGIGELSGRLWYTKGFASSKIQAKSFSIIVVCMVLIPLSIANLKTVSQNSIIKQGWPLGRLQEAVQEIAQAATVNGTIIAIGLPTRYIKFYLEPSRQDLIYLDESDFIDKLKTNTLPKHLTSRWYMIHNPDYVPINIPETWPGRLIYSQFYNIILVNLPAACDLKTCLQETQTLLTEIVAANPNSALSNRIDGILTVLATLP